MAKNIELIVRCKIEIVGTLPFITFSEAGKNPTEVSSD